MLKKFKPNEYPYEQFIVVWEYQGKVWSGTFRYDLDADILYKYISDDIDAWVVSPPFWRTYPHQIYVLD